MPAPLARLNKRRDPLPAPPVCMRGALSGNARTADGNARCMRRREHKQCERMFAVVSDRLGPQALHDWSGATEAKRADRWLRRAMDTSRRPCDSRRGSRRWRVWRVERRVTPHPHEGRLDLRGVLRVGGQDQLTHSLLRGDIAVGRAQQRERAALAVDAVPGAPGT